MISRFQGLASSICSTHLTRSRDQNDNSLVVVWYWQVFQVSLHHWLSLATAEMDCPVVMSRLSFFRSPCVLFLRYLWRAWPSSWHAAWDSCVLSIVSDFRDVLSWALQLLVLPLGPTFSWFYRPYILRTAGVPNPLSPKAFVLTVLYAAKTFSL